MELTSSRTILMIMLGALVGILAIVPLCLSLPAEQSFASFIGSAILGGLIGYKRRSSQGFFYFMLLAALVLVCLVSTNLIR